MEDKPILTQMVQDVIDDGTISAVVSKSIQRNEQNIMFRNLAGSVR
jgi:hypothetical protein